MREKRAPPAKLGNTEIIGDLDNSGPGQVIGREAYPGRGEENVQHCEKVGIVIADKQLKILVSGGKQEINFFPHWRSQNIFV